MLEVLSYPGIICLTWIPGKIHMYIIQKISTTVILRKITYTKFEQNNVLQRNKI